MKKIAKFFGLVFAMVMMAWSPAQAEHLVLVTTNDTHSMIDPDADGLGGVARRKVVIDSVRAAQPNVIVIDAGDVVQGTLYFHLYKGEVEEDLMNALGYDYRILGNHEFDNGMEQLAKNLKLAQAQFLSSDYGMKNTALAPFFKPYAVRDIAGKRVGFLAINLDPDGMISPNNVQGIEMLPIIESANLTAKFLKDIERCDKVIAITHIGYDEEDVVTDPELAAKTRNIDVIIGGHSHTDLLKSELSGKTGYTTHHRNADGKPVLITQQGKSGKTVGVIDIDLNAVDVYPDYKVVPINSRLDNRLDPKVLDIIAYYRQGVDSINAVPLIKSAIELPKGSDAIINLMADFTLDKGNELIKQNKAGRKADLAVFNKGGIRRGQPQGQIYDGNLIDMLPFYNYVVVTDVPGDELLKIFEVMGTTSGNGVSKNVKANYETYYDAASKKNKTRLVGDVLINGKKIDPKKTYRVATLDYLESGGDYMKGFLAGKRVAADDKWLYNTVMKNWRELDKKGKKLNPDTKPRWVEVGK